MDRYLLDILACPICKGKLLYEQRADELVCRYDKLAYPVRDGIPIMLPEEARTITEEA